MNILNTSENIRIVRNDGMVFDLPKGSVYANFNEDTVNFILTALPHNKGISLLSTRANDLEVNGTVYGIEDLRDGHALDGLYPIEGGIAFQLVDELPSEGSTSVIYLVPTEEAEEKNSYDEYIWFNNGWEKIGNTTKIDLDNYYTKVEADKKFKITNAYKIEGYTYDEDTNTYTITQEEVEKIWAEKPNYVLLDGALLTMVSHYLYETDYQNIFYGDVVGENGYGFSIIYDINTTPNLTYYSDNAYGVFKKMERVELFFESVASGITDKDGKTLSFDEVYELVVDTTKFVTLMYQGFNWLLPTINDNGDAIQFEGTYILSGEASIERVMINYDNEISAYSIPVENANRKKQTIDGIAEADKEKYYPSIKAVEGYVDTKIGDINNVLENLIG